MATRPPIAPPVTRILVDAVIALLLVAFAAYWWFCPKGFAVNHERFWLNSILPIVMMLLGVVAVVLHRRRMAYTGVAVLCIAAGGAAACFTGSYVFPVSLCYLWVAGLALLAAGGYVASRLFRDDRPKPFAWLPLLAGAVAVGWFTMRAQTPAPASTNPLNEPPPAADAAADTPRAIPIPCGPDRVYFPDRLQLQAQQGNLRIVYSLPFYFDRISADGFWSIFAPEANQRDGQVVTRAVPTVTSQSLSAGVYQFHYADGSAVVLPISSADRLELTSYARLHQDTYSHINVFGEIVVFGHTRPSLTFSPAPHTQIEVLPYDYPIGRAARFAYLNQSGSFCVVEAASGEKGPFRTLAEGPLARGEPVTITLHGDGQPLAAFTFADWSQQVSTALSPAAGWGVPVNAIEFRRLEEKPTSPVIITAVLAATSVGRGWDCVGHRAGTYRNRLSIEFLSNR